MQVSDIALRLLFLQFFVCFVETLKCKCTQSSGKVDCTDGVCELLSEPAVCLMLDHEVTGIHYACSRSRWQDSEQCEERTTRSGALVNVCACNVSDFCNFKNWPKRRMEDEEAFLKTSLSPEHTQSYSLKFGPELSSFLLLLFISCFI